MRQVQFPEFTFRIVKVRESEYRASVEHGYTGDERTRSKFTVGSGQFESLDSAIEFCSTQALLYDRPIQSATSGTEPFTEDGDGHVVSDGYLPVGEVVYFIQSEGGGPIKIGWSADVKRRLGDFQPGCPYPLRVLLCVRGSQYDEISLHRKFSHLRLHGEWFKNDDELVHYINSLRRNPPSSGPTPTDPNVMVEFHTKTIA